MAGDLDDEEQAVNRSALAADVMSGVGERFCAEVIADRNNMTGWFNRFIKVVLLSELSLAS